MKISPFIMITCLAFIAWIIRTNVVSNYQLERDYTQFWELADKSSTIPAKQKNISAFVDSLEKGYAAGRFASHDAIWMQTPNNSFEANLTALKSLSERLSEIQEMNPNSFEYNTAIQQITAQEQGEAKGMMGTFQGCWELSSYPLCWNWICVTLVCITILIGVGAFLAWTGM